MEAFNAELEVGSEMLDGEQAGLFRSGLGLTLYMAMDRPDIQFAVKALSSYMFRPSVQAAGTFGIETFGFIAWRSSRWWYSPTFNWRR